MWKWNPAVARYQDIETGRFIAKAKVLGYCKDPALATGTATDALATMVTDGLLGPAEWRIAFRAEIKREYIRQYVLGKGGLEQMTQVDWGSIGGMLKEQYGWIPGFEEQLLDMTEDQIAARSRMYINSGREGYERARARVADEHGYDEEIWIIDPGAENCQDCLDFAGMGWQPVGTFPFPGDGSTACLTNCKCSKSYRNTETGEEWDG